MPLTDDDRAVLRSYVPWDPPDDAALDASYDRLGSWQAVAEEEVRKLLQGLLTEPDSYTIVGVYGESWSGTIARLEKALGELGSLIPGGVVSGRMERPDVARAGRPTIVLPNGR